MASASSSLSIVPLNLLQNLTCEGEKRSTTSSAIKSSALLSMNNNSKTSISSYAERIPCHVHRCSCQAFVPRGSSNPSDLTICFNCGHGEMYHVQKRRRSEMSELGSKNGACGDKENESLATSSGKEEALRIESKQAKGKNIPSRAKEIDELLSSGFEEMREVFSLMEMAERNERICLMKVSRASSGGAGHGMNSAPNVELLGDAFQLSLKALEGLSKARGLCQSTTSLLKQKQSTIPVSLAALSNNKSSKQSPPLLAAPGHSLYEKQLHRVDEISNKVLGKMKTLMTLCDRVKENMEQVSITNAQGGSASIGNIPVNKNNQRQHPELSSKCRKCGEITCGNFCHSCGIRR